MKSESNSKTTSKLPKTKAVQSVHASAKTTGVTGDKLSNYLAMTGHICTDINQGALSACLPFFVMYYGYSYTEVAMLILAANLASAVIQPLFGTLSDKFCCPWFMPLGVALAGAGMFLVGYVNEYWLVVASAVVCGIGIAMFHPEGGRISNIAAGKRKVNGMGIFAVGGNIGFFVGPLIAAGALTAFGMHGTAAFLIPAFCCAAVLLFFNKRFLALGFGNENASTDTNQKDQWGKFSLVMGVVSVRSIAQYGLLAFIPLFFTGILNQSEATGSLMLSVFSIAGAFATISSGRVSERVGIHKVTFISLAVLTMCMLIFGLNRSIAVAVVLCMLLAACENLFHPAMTALGMSYLPQHLGTASGILYGLVLCVGGISEPFLGLVGDNFGLPVVFFVLAAVAFIGTVLACVVKKVDEG